MNRLDATVVFFGNGPVASASLQGFVDTFGLESIEAVVTKARATHHKDIAPVEQLATDLGLPIWLASNKSELADLIEVKKPESHVGIVIDYGVVMSAQTINHFAKGIINSHFSLLPEWRGADPITYSLLSGQAKTGVSIMLIDEGLDTGPLLAVAEYSLEASETATSLIESLVELSNSTIAHILPLYLKNELKPAEQTKNVATYSRKLTKQDGQLVFTKTAEELEREVRAFSGWPKSRTPIGIIDCAIIRAEVSPSVLKPGQIQVTAENNLLIGCRVGSLNILEVQPAGKNKMPVSAFLNGYGHLL